MEFVYQTCCLAYLTTKYLWEPSSKSYASIFFLRKIYLFSKKFMRNPALGERGDRFPWHLGLSHHSSVIGISKSEHTAAGTWRQLFRPCVESMSVCWLFVGLCCLHGEAGDPGRQTLLGAASGFRASCRGTDRREVSPGRTLMASEGPKPLSLYDLITPLCACLPLEEKSFSENVQMKY